MANAKQCDICSGFYAASKTNRRLGSYEYADTDAVILIRNNPSADASDDRPLRNEELETCPKCMGKIKAFIDSMKADSHV